MYKIYVLRAHRSVHSFPVHALTLIFVILIIIITIMTVIIIIIIIIVEMKIITQA